MSQRALTKGELQTALSNAMVRVKREYYGKGAARARTFVFDEYVFTVLEDVFTTAERGLKAGGDGELVREVRLAFQDLMTRAFVEPVEALTGRTVVGYHSATSIEQESVLEIFILDPQQPGITEPESDSGEVRAGGEEPGNFGDADALPSPGERPPPSPAGSGVLRTAISNALVRLLSERYGRGAARARTYVSGRYVFCAMEGMLTTVERTLVDGGQGALVRRVRQRFHHLHGAVFEEVVAQLAGRPVAGSEAQVIFDPDTLILVFQLDETR